MALRRLTKVKPEDWDRRPDRTVVRQRWVYSGDSVVLDLYLVMLRALLRVLGLYRESGAVQAMVEESSSCSTLKRFLSLT